MVTHLRYCHTSRVRGQEALECPLPMGKVFSSHLFKQGRSWISGLYVFTVIISEVTLKGFQAAAN